MPRLWLCRFPDAAWVESRGLVGDRLWSVRDTDGKFGSGKSTRRFRRMDGLLSLVAHYDGDVPIIEFPDGTRRSGHDSQIHDALSTHVGRPVTLGREDGIPHFDEGPIHLLTLGTLRRLEQAHGSPVDVRRLRPNLVLDTSRDADLVEEHWIGRRLAIGSDVVLGIRSMMPRCVMVNLAQKDLPGDAGVLRTATGLSEAMIGVVADVVERGRVTVGDQVRLLD